MILWHGSRSNNIHLEFLQTAKFNLKKMFSVPKSKSPWEAMTAGSTGGWAKGLEPWGPAFTAAAGAIPAVGPFISAGMGAAGMAGKGSGFQGTDAGWGNLGSTLWGGLSGWGLGGVGAGLAGGLKGGIGAAMNAKSRGLISDFWTGAKHGFGQGLSKYWGATTAPFKAIGSALNLGGGGAAGAQSASPFAGAIGTGSDSASKMATMQNYANIVGGGTQGAGSAAGGGGLFGLGIGGKELLGAGLMGASALMKPPNLSQSPQDLERAKQAVYAPDLVQARDMIREMALRNPAELVNPASDQYIEATLRQSRQAYDRMKQEAINTYSARGMTVGKSGQLNERLARMDQEQSQGESDYITKVQEARYLAGISQKVQAIQQYYGTSQEEAAQLLQAYGYISTTDMQNYMNEMQAYNNLQNAMGYAGGIMAGGGNVIGSGLR